MTEKSSKSDVMDPAKRATLKRLATAGFAVPVVSTFVMSAATIDRALAAEVTTSPTTTGTTSPSTTSTTPTTSTTSTTSTTTTTSSSTDYALRS